MSQPTNYSNRPITNPETKLLLQINELHNDRIMFIAVRPTRVYAQETFYYLNYTSSSCKSSGSVCYHNGKRLINVVFNTAVI